MAFADKILSGNHRQGILVYEEPPPARYNRHGSGDMTPPLVRIKYVFGSLAKRGYTIDAVNLPHIQENGVPEKYKPLEIAACMKSTALDGLDIIVNHPVRNDGSSYFAGWLKQAGDAGVSNIVVVGGASGEIEYPGPTVAEAARIARSYSDSNGGNLLIGGICIPERRREEYDEPQRMADKGRAGIDFFTTQVIYNRERAKKLLLDYSRLCDDIGESPRTILLSFSPVVSREDVAYLEKLRVDVPESVTDHLFSGGLDAPERCINLVSEYVEDIFSFAIDRDLPVPLGLNIERIRLSTDYAMNDFIEALARAQERLYSRETVHES